jgi:general secretion pathway protein H
MTHCQRSMASGASGVPVASGFEAGFTLIEMLVVLAVLGLTMGLVATSGPKRSAAVEMQAVVQRVAQTARLARSRAIAGNRVVRLVLDLPAHSLRIDNAVPTLLPPTMRISMTAVSGESVGGTLAAIRFNPDGSATGGRIELADGPRRALIGVDWLTSRVSIEQPQ